MPARGNPMVDNQQRGSEAMIAIERELEGADSDGCPLREEGYVHLRLRVERAFKINSWSENPPARTRRMVSNVEILTHDAEQAQVYSNFLLYYSRHTIVATLTTTLFTAGSVGICCAPVKMAIVLPGAKLSPTLIPSRCQPWACFFDWFGLLSLPIA